ncbi:MAG: trehalose-phosphatase [Methylobacteriaceae bacterium]|nr:trehalose-phosphatase [Methylobacteriaceae bacterium]
MAADEAHKTEEEQAAEFVSDLAAVAPPDSCAYFFDVDGTLLELRRRPEEVVADEHLRGLLTRLQTAAGGAVALVSGRSITDLDRIFDPLTLPAAGLHGADIRFPDGSRQAARGDLMNEVRPLVAAFAASHDGIWLEDKGATLAIHFRERPELAGDVLAFLSQFQQGRDLAVQEGKMVVELKSAAHDKGTAIKTLLQRTPFEGRRPVFVGDDLTDEHGFAEVQRSGGVAIRIGVPDVPTEARLHMPDPAYLRERLRELAAHHLVLG